MSTAENSSELSAPPPKGPRTTEWQTTVRAIDEQRGDADCMEQDRLESHEHLVHPLLTAHEQSTVK